MPMCATSPRTRLGTNATGRLSSGIVAFSTVPRRPHSWPKRCYITFPHLKSLSPAADTRAENTVLQVGLEVEIWGVRTVPQLAVSAGDTLYEGLSFSLTQRKWQNLLLHSLGIPTLHGGEDGLFQAKQLVPHLCSIWAHLHKLPKPCSALRLLNISCHQQKRQRETKGDSERPWGTAQASQKCPATPSVQASKRPSVQAKLL